MILIKRIVNISVLSVVMVLAMHNDAAAIRVWPEVEEFEQSYYFDDVTEAGLDIFFRGPEGEVLYQLKCHNNLYEDDMEFNYSGAFQCRLKSLYSKETVSTLFAEGTSSARDWENRGRFLTGHLLGECSNYKDWGRKRVFTLRGMMITLEINDEKVVLDAEKKQVVLQAFKFTVKVNKDTTAITQLADISPIPEPVWFYNPATCLVESLGVER